ncbi:MAG: folate family ECF transporter S component [Firmicutes bacterium]|nr:folate family ECF transporter S component [Bacillota bacterium]
MSEQNQPAAQQEIASQNVDHVLEPTAECDASKSPYNGFIKLPPTLRLTVMATLVAIAIVTKFMLRIPVSPTSVITFFYIPCFLAGALFGPVFGFATGAIADIVGNIVAPTGPYIPIITIGNGLLGMIFGTVFALPIKKVPAKFGIAAAIALITVTLGINTIGLTLTYDGTAGFINKYWARLITGNPWPRIIFQPIVFIGNVFIAAPLYYAAQKHLVRIKFRQK